MSAFNPRDLSPRLEIFDESDGVTQVDLFAYGLDVGDMTDCDERKATTLLARVLSSPLMTEIEGNGGIIVLTFPKGLASNELIKFAEPFKVGKTDKLIRYCISSGIGDVPVDRTYRIVITDYSFERTLRLSLSKIARRISPVKIEPLNNLSRQSTR